MEIKLQNKKDNKLLARTEIGAEISYDGATPSNEAIRKAFTEQFKADEKLIIIKHVYTGFGITKADVLAFIYHDQKALEQFELIKKKPKKKAEAAAAAPEKKK